MPCGRLTLPSGAGSERFRATTQAQRPLATVTLGGKENMEQPESNDAAERASGSLERMVRCLAPEQMRDYIIRAHGMATANYVQSDTEMRRRIGAMLETAIREDDVMLGFLG